MKALVTGGAGFIGSHLSDRLIQLGHEVLIVDNFYSGKKENLNPKAKLYEVDITDFEKLKDVFEKEKPEIVFHLAAQSYVSISTKKPMEDARINVIGSVNLIHLSKEYNVKKLIYSNSGGASYGNPLYMPIDEKHSINPVCQYGISKHTVEHYLYLYNYNYGLKYTSLRYANIYGPRQDPYGEGGVVAIFTNCLLKNQRPTIFGDGSQIRDYCFVQDVVDANIWAMSNGDNDFFNVGTGAGTSTQKVFDAIKNELGLNLEVIYAPERVGDAKACVLDSNKLQSNGWKPKYNFEQGIKETIAYFKSIIK